MADIAEHAVLEGKVCLAVVVNVWLWGVFGWSIADHLRTGLVVVALGMVCWRRKPVPGQVVHHADYGTQYSFWVFGQRLRQVGLFGFLGTVGDAFDSAMAESFFGTLQLELLDRRIWQTCRELAQAVFGYIGDLRVHRSLLQPRKETLLVQQPVTHRLRDVSR